MWPKLGRKGKRRNILPSSDSCPNLDDMTVHADTGLIPELTLGWRLRMARELTGMGLREFAAHIGVAPDTLTSAEKDRRKVRPITINAYALATGVDREWLETGKTPDQPEPDGGLPEVRAWRYSKPQPSDPKVLPLRRVA